jgi:hypothetical protein
MSSLSDVRQKQYEIVEKLQDRLLIEAEHGKGDELRNVSVALGIATDKLYMRPTGT